MLPSLPTATLHARGPSPTSRAPAWQEALNKARDALGGGNAQAAVHRLSTDLGRNEHAFHNALLNLLESAPSQMRQQLVSQAVDQRPGFALDAHNREGKTALGLAVRHDDTEFADYLLRHGADPNRTSLTGGSAEMQTLVTRWRLKNLLYADRAEAAPRSRRRSSYAYQHPRPSNEKRTPLDRALSKGRFKEADEMLQKEIGGNSLEHHADLWRTAMEEEWHDVLRAMLILRRDALHELAQDKQEVGEWVEELRRDPGLSAALKEFPYQPAKRGEPEQLNCEAQFHRTAKRIDCRHLATYQQEVQALDEKIKFNYERFSDAETIADNVPPEIEETYRELITQASATHLVDNSKFGQFLAGQFQEMEGEDKPATRLMLVESTNHTMNLGLMIKEKGGKTSYVVKFFDPNDTTTHVRSKAGSVQTFEMQTIEDYLSDEDLRDYYPEAKGLSMIYVRPLEEEQTDDPASVSVEDKRLTTCIDIEEVDATAVWHFMARGFTANLRNLQGHLGTLPEAQRIELLTGKDVAANSALFMAMQDGHAEAVKTYGELMRQAEPLSEEQRIELLAGKNAQGTSALFVAMQDGHTEAIKAYGELVQQAESLSEQQRIKLLEGKEMDGIPALAQAAYDGRVESIRAYGEAIQWLLPDKQADLLLAKISEGEFAGKSGFDIAVNQGHFGAARAQLKLLARLAPSLSKDKRAELREELQSYQNGISKMPIPSSAILEWRKMLDALSKLKTELISVPNDA